MSEKIKIKDNINFLENPNWVATKRNISSSVFIKSEKGLYEINSQEELPSLFDKIVLYCLLYLLSKQKDKNDFLITTRYEIAKNVFSQNKNFSQSKYSRIMLSLKKWHSITIEFKGCFLENGDNLDKKFNIIDDFHLDSDNKLIIKLNEKYLEQLETASYYKFIDFNEYKSLKRPIANRLYELLIKNFEYIWCIDLDELNKKLGLEIKTFSSQIISLIKPAIEEINKKTSLKIGFYYNKESNTCIFKK